MLGRGRSRNLALRLPGTRDRRRARRSTTSGVAWEFCCSGEMLRFWETGSPTSHHHKLMDWMSKNLWFTISIALSLTQSSVHLLEIYPHISTKASWLAFWQTIFVYKTGVDRTVKIVYLLSSDLPGRCGCLGRHGRHHSTRHRRCHHQGGHLPAYGKTLD